MKRYLAGFWCSAKIELVEIERETTACVFRHGDRRYAKNSDNEKYCDTWAEAKQYLLEKAEKQLISARRQLETAQGQLGNIKGMKEPV